MGIAAPKTKRVKAGAKKTRKQLQGKASASGRVIKAQVKGKLLTLSLARHVSFDAANPKKAGTVCFKRYARYHKAPTLGEALLKGASSGDLKWDLAKGYARLPGRSAAAAGRGSSSSSSTATQRKAVKPVGRPLKPASKALSSGKVKAANKVKGKFTGTKSVGKVKGKFTGKKLLRKDGLIRMDRKFTDLHAWEQRRKQEQPPPGGWPKPPSHWPPGVRVDVGRPVEWLPADWGQGIKTTCASKLQCFVSPDGKAYYHRHVVEQVCGKPCVGSRNPVKDLDPETAELYKQRILVFATAKAKASIAQGQLFSKAVPKFDKDSKLFANLSAAERAHIPSSASELHFAVISARRANDEQGLRNIVSVETQLRLGGATPVWYVDEPSLASYRGLGLTAKVGGKLVPARNLALSDAQKMGKPCVQVSDDIQRWNYYVGEDLRKGDAKVDLAAGNEAAKSADRLRANPVSAARFLVAKLRGEAASSSGGSPKLAGVFPLGNLGQAFLSSSVSREHFILGDFFVADNSPCRFDARMTLKEDYDFTCAHLQKHGSVIRCNRLFVSAVHETNAGGAVSERDDSGHKERANIKILQEKWPGVFSINGNRGDTQVIMSWKRRKSSNE